VEKSTIGEATEARRGEESLVLSMQEIANLSCFYSRIAPSSGPFRATNFPENALI
jgi:hypothetical protein